MSTAESLLAKNAYLNPLLGSTLGSVRAFSTSIRYQAEAAAAKEYDPGQQGLLDATERQPLKEAGPSPKKNQATQKTRLLRDLRSNAAPDGDHAAPSGASIAPEDLTPQALALRLAGLEATLESAETIDWKERYSRAQQALSIKDRHDFKNLNQLKRLQFHRKAQEQYDETIAEIRRDRAEHKASKTQLREDIAMLRGHLNQRDHALVDLRKRKLDLLKRRDALALELAQLRAGKQLNSSQVGVTSHAEAIGTSGETASTTSNHSQDPSPSEPLIDNEPEPDVDANTVHFDIHKLRLHMPGNIIKIDSSLTIDLTPQTTIKQLREQLAALQARLREFHPPLDTLPANIKPRGKRPSRKTAYMLKTWLRILVSRYQAKTGVYGEPVEEKEPKGVRELNDEAKERMARRWNEKFGKKRGVLMDEGNLERKGGGKVAMAVAEEAAQPIKYEDHNEMGFLEDEYATEEELLAAQNGSKSNQTAAQASDPPSWRPGTITSKGPKAPTQPPVPSTQRRAYSTRAPSLDTLNASLQEKESAEQAPASAQPQPNSPPETSPPPHLPHLTSTGTAHMVPITHKPSTSRTAIAVGTVYFSNPVPLSLITSNSLKKGDVLSVSRIAGIMAAKKCPEIVPLCHPIMLTHVGVELRTFDNSAAEADQSQSHFQNQNQGSERDPTSVPSGPDNMAHGGVQIECTVACAGSTGVEMEALTAVMGTALSVVDMCKAVDKFQRIGDVRVVLKEGGKSGVWREEGWTSWQKKG